MNSKKIEKKFDFIRTAVAIGIALVLAFLIISLVSENPIDALKQFLLGPFESIRRMGNIVEMAIPLIFTGLAVCVMFQANQFNMAGEGAFFLGAVASTAIATRVILPMGLHPIVAILAGGVVGSIICGIPAVLKMKWKCNEVVSSLMLNYIALYMGRYIINYKLRDPDAGFMASEVLAKTAKLPNIIPKTRIHAGLLIAIVLIILTYLFIYKSKWGYALRMTGQNEKFAKYSGMSVAAVILYSQLIGGFIAGAGGATEILGMYNRFQYQALPQYGFDGIMIAILAKNNPIYVPLAAIFLAYIRVGADIMARTTDVPTEIVNVVQAVMIMLIAAKMFLEAWKHKEIVKNSKEFVEVK